jgi:hypothetical protein
MSVTDEHGEHSASIDEAPNRVPDTSTLVRSSWCLGAFDLALFPIMLPLYSPCLHPMRSVTKE